MSWIIGKVSILLWNRSRGVSGDWDEPILKSTPQYSHNVHVADVNNDGQNDIVVSNAGDDTISIFLWNTFSGDWDEALIKSVGAVPFFDFVGDLNNDGQNDIVVSNAGDDTISIFLWIFDSETGSLVLNGGDDDDSDGNGDEEAIFGYDIIAIIALIGCVVILLIKKRYKQIN